jgi:hypothetical protein
MRVKILKVLNPILLIAVAHQFMSGLVPSLYGEWNYPIHQVGAYVILGFVLMHLALNWGWIRSTYLTRRVQKR